MNKQDDILQTQNIIRYDVGGRPTFFTVPDALVKITEENEAQPAGEEKSNDLL